MWSDLSIGFVAYFRGRAAVEKNAHDSRRVPYPVLFSALVCSVLVCSAPSVAVQGERISVIICVFCRGWVSPRGKVTCHSFHSRPSPLWLMNSSLVPSSSLASYPLLFASHSPRCSLRRSNRIPHQLFHSFTLPLEPLAVSLSLSLALPPPTLWPTSHRRRSAHIPSPAPLTPSSIIEALPLSYFNADDGIDLRQSMFSKFLPSVYTILSLRRARERSIDE